MICQIHGVRPRSVCLLFGGIPDDIVLTVHRAPCRQIYLLIFADIRYNELHRAAIRGDCGRDPGRQLFHVRRGVGEHLHFAVFRAVYVDQVVPGGVVIRQIHGVRPRSVGLLDGGIPDDIILTVHRTPDREVDLVIPLDVFGNDLHCLAVCRDLGRSRRTYRVERRDIHLGSQLCRRGLSGVTGPYMHIVNARGLMPHQVDSAVPFAVRLLCGGIPDDIVLTVFLAPDREPQILAGICSRKGEVHPCAVQIHRNADPIDVLQDPLRRKSRLTLSEPCT